MKKIVLLSTMIFMSIVFLACSEKTYTVTFDSNGGSEVSAQTVIENQVAIKPNNPSYPSFYLVEWQLDGVTYNFTEPVTSDIVLVALWEEETYENPVWEPILADPSVIRHEGTYYAVGTQDDGVWGNEYGVKYGPIIASEDLVNWTYVGSIFSPANRPGWGTLNAGIWAPDIVKINNKFLVYYSLSTWGDPNPGIGVASADHPAGPWVDHGELFKSLSIGVNNSIDSSVFQDQDGRVYMIWGSFRGLYGIELTSDGLTLKGGIEYAALNKVHIAGYDTSTPWNGATYEAPYIIYKDGYYYMFTSSGTCCNGLNSTYNVRVSRSENPLGPYVDHLDRSMLQANVGFQVLQGSSKFVGVGHNGITIDDAGNYWIVYHGFDLSQPSHVGNSNRRSMFIDLLLWSDDGWPYVKDLVPSNGNGQKPIIHP